MTDATLVKTHGGLLLVIDGSAELFLGSAGEWRGKDEGWVVRPVNLLDGRSTQSWEGFEFRHNGELLDWVFYIHEGAPCLCRITETRRVS
jgi:hypothetical protein